VELSGETILITGGGGHRRGLAEAFRKTGNQVIITGRRQAVFDEARRGNPGMKSIMLDVDKAEAVQSFATKVIALVPKLNVLINNVHQPRGREAS
jgi:uncharacterized oxidoreductase